MINNCKDELIIKLVGKLSQEFTEIDQLKVRSIIEETFYKYDITSQETALITSDIEDKFQMYLAVKRLEGASEKTLKNYNYNLAIFASFMKKPVSTVTANDIRIFLANRCQNLKATSTNAQISILKSFFSWLYNEEYIPRNPMLKIKKVKEPKRLRHPLKDEETEILRLACKDDREKALLELLLSSGIRLSEAVKLNVSDIDWYGKSFSTIGKGDKERTVCFSTKAKVLMENYLLSRKGTSDALFIGVRAPYKRIGQRAIESIISKIAKRTNFDKSVFPHLCRHTFATHNLNAGMPLPVLQKLMGHSNADTTMIYAEVSEENLIHEYRRIS